MRPDHSLENRIAYERERARPIWPPPDLQIDFGKMARKTSDFVSTAVRRLSIRSNSQPTKAVERTENISRPRLRRSLTIKGDSSQSQDLASCASQFQSPLLQLSLELRQEIYTQVLGYSNIHVITTRGGKHLRHLRCKCDTCPGFAFCPERGKYRSEWSCDGTKYTIDTSRVPAQLLRTCRQIYSEAIDLLYSSNIFSFKNPGVLLDFITWTLPQRCSAIETVHLDLSFARPPNISVSSQDRTAEFEMAFWKGAWDALASLPNLQNIQIRIHPSGGQRADEHFRLEHLKQLTEKPYLRECRIYASEEVPLQSWMLEAPFEVVALDQWEWNPDWPWKQLVVF